MKTQRCMRMWVLAASILFIGAQAATATTSVTLGEQDFINGETPSTLAFNNAAAGEQDPFDDGFLGSDSGANFSASWTFSYAPQAPVTGGTVTLGIVDHDSAATGDQIGSFTLNGIDLTTELNAQFESYGGASSEYNEYTLELPNSTFADLASGTVTFALTLQGPGLSILGETSFNGAGLDFSTLNVRTGQTPAVPEPSTMGLLLLGLPALLAARRKMS